MNTRAVAADILSRVMAEGRSLTPLMESSLAGIPRPVDRAFVQAICYGVLRHYWGLSRILASLTRKPIRDPQIQALALIGLYQLRSMRVKPHAAVSETVAAAGGKAWARPLLNALLRNYPRRVAELEALARGSEESALDHPVWLIERLRQDWPEDAARLMAANNQPAPMVLRVNRLRGSREAYRLLLNESGVSGECSSIAPDAIVLERPVPVELLPGFGAGDLSVQDAAAQLAAGLLDPGAGHRVLDLCAAPGGKTAHLLETQPELAEMVAVDSIPERLQRVRETLDRIGLVATCIEGDATRAADWWDGRPFDRILVDAPCSATGVIRRHPDIKLLRRPGDLPELTRIQALILDQAWRMLVPGGRLLYSTCSVLRAENERVIAAFLARHPDARSLAIAAEWGRNAGHGRQILTGEKEMDGFYFALLEKGAP